MVFLDLLSKYQMIVILLRYVYVFVCWGEGGRERGIMDNDNRLETEARGKKADQTE